MPVWREQTVGEAGGEVVEEEQRVRNQRGSRGRAPQGLGFIEILDDMAERRGEMDAQRAERRR